MTVAVCRPLRQLVAATCLGLLVAAAGWPRHAAGANVLAIEPVAAKSHWAFTSGVLRALVNRGHRVTVYTPFPERASPVTENYTEVDTSGEFNLLAVNMNVTVVFSVFSRLSTIVPFLANTSRAVCDLADKLAADVAAGGHAFDLLVTKPLTSECVSHAARRLGVPLVYAIPGPLLPWLDTGLFGGYANPSYVPHVLSPYGVPDTFTRRLHNVGLHLYSVYLHYRTTAALATADGRLYDRLPPVKPSLVFVNTHHVTETARPTSVDRVNVGGIHLRTPVPLPADILKFIEDSPHGVIFFTFGTIVALSTLPDHIQKAFKDALAEVPQRVLLKYEREMKDKPANMMTSKWLPQRDVLLHPKVKLFISHGGISGVYETVDAGVPVLGFPLFYDQPRNIENLVEAGMAISMNLMTVTKEKLLNAINEIINNETYSRNAKITSERFKDRPMSPAESVVYWTEYVLRHKGAPHLKSNAHNLTWYQYFLLDVIAVVLLAVLLVFYVTYKMLKCLKNCIVRKMVPRSKSKAD